MRKISLRNRSVDKCKRVAFCLLCISHIKLFTEHSTTCDSRTNLNYISVLSSSSSSCSVLLPRFGCNGPPFLVVLCLSDCLVVLQSCPFSDVCCPLRSRSSASSRAVHLSIQNCAMQCVSILVDDVLKIL